MTAAQRRAAALERRAAKALGTTRVVRQRGESAPDLVPPVVNGVALLVECKHRKRLPAAIVGWLAQAWSYVIRYRQPGQAPRPLLVLSESGKTPLVVMDLATFRQLVGLAPLPPPPPQGSLDLRPPEGG